MLYDLKLENILFLDIETVPAYKSFDDLHEKSKELWALKAERIDREKTAAEVYERAGIYAEFGKIVCISIGGIRTKNGEKFLKLKSFYDHDEKVLLQEFKKLLDNYYNEDKHMLCGHNGKEFDFPYIARRMLVNGFRLPKILNIAGSKPWEVKHLDTMELWKFGDYKTFTSLNLMTHIFNIPTPKDDISGADVGKVYWQENDLKRIAVYCEKDVKATVQLLLKFRGEELIPEANIEHTEK